jgi:hypothetical protein
MALRATQKRLEIDQDATIRNCQCADVAQGGGYHFKSLQIRVHPWLKTCG